MELRLLITLAIGLTFVAALLATRWWLRRRQTNLLGLDASEFTMPGHTTVLYFYTDTCEPCRREQKPELELLATHTPNVIVRAIDAVAERPIARRFKILSVPTTMAIGDDGRIRAVNYGVARRDRLLGQVLAA
jgi:thiol-disulfide isomerase/thioredoxin